MNLMRTTQVQRRQRRQAHVAQPATMQCMMTLQPRQKQYVWLDFTGIIAPNGHRQVGMHAGDPCTATMACSGSGSCTLALAHALAHACPFCDQQHCKDNSKVWYECNVCIVQHCFCHTFAGTCKL